MKDAYTPWYPFPEFKPEKEGVYEVHMPAYPTESCFSYWSGAKFGYITSMSVRGRADQRAYYERNPHHNTNDSITQWRGLTAHAYTYATLSGKLPEEEHS